MTPSLPTPHPPFSPSSAHLPGSSVELADATTTDRQILITNIIIIIIISAICMPEFIQHAKGCLCNHVSISDNNIHSIINNNTNVDGFYNRQTIHGKHAWHGKSFVR